MCSPLCLHEFGVVLFLLPCVSFDRPLPPVTLHGVSVCRRWMVVKGAAKAMPVEADGKTPPPCFPRCHENSDRPLRFIMVSVAISSYSRCFCLHSVSRKLRTHFSSSHFFAFTPLVHRLLPGSHLTFIMSPYSNYCCIHASWP